MKLNKLIFISLVVCNVTFAALNDTGITTGSNETQNGLPCPVAGFPGQDGEILSCKIF